MAPKPAEPNRLRQSVEANTLRGFDTPGGSWLAKGATAGSRSRRGAPAPQRARARRRPSIGPRGVARLGFLLAMVGVLPFLNAEFRWQEVGLGMICGGLGLVLLAASPGIFRSRVGAFGRSRGSTLGAMLAAPHWTAVPAIGACLLVVGVLLLMDAAIGG